jgi:hypothetical protein
MLSILTRWNKTRHIMNIHENTICCYRMLQGEAPPACDASSALGSAGAATIKITHSDKFDTRQVNTCIVYMFHIKAPHCNLQWVARNLSALWRRCDELSRLSISSLQLALELALAPVLLRVQTTTMSKLPMNKPQNIQTALNSRTGHIWCITFVANLFLGNLLLKILFERNFYLQPCAFRGRAFLGSPVRKTWCILYILSNPRGNLAFLEVCGEAAWSCLKLVSCWAGVSMFSASRNLFLKQALWELEFLEAVRVELFRSVPCFKTCCVWEAFSRKNAALKRKALTYLKMFCLIALSWNVLCAFCSVLLLGSPCCIPWNGNDHNPCLGKSAKDVKRLVHTNQG